MQIDAAVNDANDDANDDHRDAASLRRERSPQHVAEPVKLVKKCEPMVQCAPPGALRFFLAGSPCRGLSQLRGTFFRALFFGNFTPRDVNTC